MILGGHPDSDLKSVITLLHCLPIFLKPSFLELLDRVLLSARRFGKDDAGVLIVIASTVVVFDSALLFVFVIIIVLGNVSACYSRCLLLLKFSPSSRVCARNGQPWPI